MNPSKFVLLTIVLACLFSCSESPVNSEDLPNQLTPITVTVTERSASRAVINWTESINMGSAEQVKYKVILNDHVIHTGLVRLSDTLFNLSPNLIYQGRVVGYTSADDSISANFVLSKLENFIAYHSATSDKLAVTAFRPVSIMWSFPSVSVNGLDGSPTIAGDTVFYSVSNNGGNTVFAFNLNTGAYLWSALPHFGSHGIPCEGTSPIYENGKLFIASSAGILALNASNGQVVWHYNHSMSPWLGTTSTPVLSNGRVFVSNDSLFALNSNTGQLLWKVRSPGLVNPRPLLVNNMIITSFDDKLWALNQSNGSVIWQRNIENTCTSWV